MVSFPGESAMGLGRVGASVQGRGKGSRKGKWGVCRKREGRETGDPLPRCIQEKLIFACFSLFSNVTEGT